MMSKAEMTVEQQHEHEIRNLEQAIVMLQHRNERLKGQLWQVRALMAEIAHEACDSDASNKLLRLIGKAQGVLR
jgi:hypothetical protein